MGEDAVLSQNISERMSLVTGVRQHLEFGHEKYVMETIQNHSTQIYEDLESRRPSLKLLYVTPELITTPGFSSKLTKLHARVLLHLIAIDE
ncbi:hypothetical protein Dimus_018261, partial [Dionaea muscipula]